MNERIKPRDNYVRCNYCNTNTTLIFYPYSQLLPHQEHWYAPGYGLVFEAEWTFYPSWSYCPGTGYEHWHYFATWSELHVEVFHRDYAQGQPARSIVDEDSIALANLTWHWTDEETEP